MTTTGAPADEVPPVDECPDCQQQGNRDGRVLIDGCGIYRCPEGHMWQDADERQQFKGAFLINAPVSDSPPGAVGLGLVPPGPNPTAETEGAK